MPVAGHLYDNGPRVRPFLLSEASNTRSRDVATIKVTGSVIKSGTLLGKITDAGADQGKLVAYSNAASNGSQTCVGILYESTDAVTGDVKKVIINADAEVNRFELTGLDTAGETDLLALGIKVRGKTGSLTIDTPAL